MNYDDPFAPAPAVDDAPLDVSPIGAPERSLAVLSQTVVLEGEMPPPATLRLEDKTLGAYFTAVLTTDHRMARQTFAVVLTVLAVGSLIAAIASSGLSAICGQSLWAVILFVVVRRAWSWARIQQLLQFDGATFSVKGIGFAPKALQQHPLAMVHGFGYQRASGLRTRYQLVVVYKSGWTAPIDLACVRREEVRFVARRLNAALADVQRSR